MAERTRSGDPSPGDVRPLDRPPGRRYQPPAPTDGAPSTATARAAAAGTAVALVFALAWGLLQAVLDLDLGLIAIAIAGGWAIGTAVAWAAWRTAERPPAPRVQALAAALAALGWLGGWFVAYLVALAILPGSTLTFGERLAQQPFLAWFAPQLFILDAIELALVTVIAWRSAR